MSAAGNSAKRVYVAGASGMVGSAITRRLERDGYDVLTGPAPRPDLRDQQTARALMHDLKPDRIFLAAAKVGGILANSTHPADFIYDNLMIQSNVIQAAYEIGVEKLMFLGSSCIYPRLSPQPIREEYLLSGPLEPTNEPYAVAKIAGIVMAQSFNRQHGTNYVPVMPTNLYGPKDNFDLENSHVIPALMRKAHEAKVSGADHMVIWGSGRPRREFLHVDDLADACVFLMERYDSGEVINIGTGTDISVGDLAFLIKDVVGFDGEIRFDTSKPDGMPEKRLDVSKLHKMGWSHSIGLRDGLTSVYAWYLAHESSARR